MRPDSRALQQCWHPCRKKWSNTPKHLSAVVLKILWLWHSTICIQLQEEVNGAAEKKAISEESGASPSGESKSTPEENHDDAQNGELAVPGPASSNGKTKTPAAFQSLEQESDTEHQGEVQPPAFQTMDLQPDKQEAGKG